MATIDIDTNHQHLCAQMLSTDEDGTNVALRKHNYGQLDNALKVATSLTDAEIEAMRESQTPYNPSLDDKWVYVGMYDNTATAAYGNLNARKHYLHACINQDGMLQLEWLSFSFINSDRSFAQVIEYKLNEVKTDSKHNPLRIATQSEVIQYMMDGPLLKAYTHPKLLCHWSWSGFYLRSGQISKAFGCPYDIWITSHDNVIYLYLHTPLDMGVFEGINGLPVEDFLPTEITDYYEIMDSGTQQIFRPKINYIANNLMSKSPVIHNRVIAQVLTGGELRYHEVGDMYPSIQCNALWGIYPLTVPPYYQSNNTNNDAYVINDANDKNASDISQAGLIMHMPYSYNSYRSTGTKEVQKRVASLRLISEGNSLSWGNIV